MRKRVHSKKHLVLLWCLCQMAFVGLCLESDAQTYHSRDGHTGLWKYRSSWQQNWAGISNSIDLAADVRVHGYLIHGLSPSPADLSFRGVAAQLIVNDTLRVHGNLSLHEAASLQINAGGVLIVHGNYEQEAGVSFSNQGQAIFLGDWISQGSTGSFSNTGNLYVAGTVSQGGHETGHKAYSVLETDDAVLYYFTLVGAHREGCEGNNAGTFTLEASGSQIIRWESSLDFFLNDNTHINHQETTYNYENLFTTTSFRVYLKNGGSRQYSRGVSVIVQETALGGTLSGPEEGFCGISGTNSGTLTLTDFLGGVVRWESSTDDFGTISSSLASTEETYTFSDLSTSTSFRAVLKNGDCEEVYSIPFTVEVFPESEGGVVEGSTTVCKGDNSGGLSLSGHVGDVIRWESAESSDFSGLTSIAQTTTALSYENLNATTYYRAVLQSGPCDVAFSTTATIEVEELLGGSLSGSQTVCAGTNSGTLTLSANTGNVLYWESSTDDFLSAQRIEHTEAAFSFSDLTETTSYRVVVGNNGVCPESSSTEVQVIVNADIPKGNLATVLPQTLSTELIAFYPLNGNVSDFSGNSNHGIGLDPALSVNRFDEAEQAYSFNGIDDIIATTTQYPDPGPQVFSISLWFKTSTSRGGKLIGFENSQTGTSTNYDRHIYLNDQGQLFFGLYYDGGISDAYVTLKTADAYNDGQWHQVLASVSAAGMKLHVDGDLKGTDANPEAEIFSGYWRMGYGSLSGWPEEPSNPYFEGDLDEVYIYGKELSAQEINELYAAGWEPYCEGESIKLMATTVAGATYSWSGPNSFSSDEQNPLINGLTADHAGTYTVTVSKEGCSGQGSVSIVMATAEGGSVVADQNSVCVGENNGTLILESYSGEILRWESSTDGFADDVQVITNSTNEVSYNNLNTSTSYRAVVSNGSCGEVNSTVATIAVDQEATAGSINGSTTICAAENSGTLVLETYSGTILRWESSTDGFVNNVQAISNVTDAHSYNNLSATTSYRAVVSNGSCGELYSEEAAVTVEQEATAGSISGSTTVCAAENNGALVLESYSGDILRWESSTDRFSDDVQVIPNATNEVNYTNLSTSTSYRAVVSNGSCGEVISTVATIAVDQESTAGSINGSTTVCAAENSGTLVLESYSGTILRWESSTDGFVNDVQAISNVTDAHSYNNLSATTSYRAVVSNGSCGEVYSEEAAITVEQEARADSISGSATVCAAENNGTLTLESYSGEILRWERSLDAFESHVEHIALSGDSHTYTNLTESYAYRAVIGLSACGEVFSETATVLVEEAPLGGLVSGGSRIIAGDNEGVLQLEGQLGTILHWERSNDNFENNTQVLNYTEASLPYQNLEQDTWYRALVGSGGACSPVYASTAVLRINSSPVAGEDTFSLSAEEAETGFSSDKSLLANDYDPEADPLLITSGEGFVTKGGNSLSIDEKGYIHFKAQQGFAGEDTLEYELCNNVGEASLCVYGLVILNIEERPEEPEEPEIPDNKLVIYQGVSPNGDGLNDQWIIENVENYPQNLVQIFDRSGVLVYQVQGYNNADKVFIGVSNKGLATGSNELPEATYYYRIRLNEVEPPLRGFVILNR